MNMHPKTNHVGNTSEHKTRTWVDCKILKIVSTAQCHVCYTIYTTTCVGNTLHFHSAVMQIYTYKYG